MTHWALTHPVSLPPYPDVLRCPKAHKFLGASGSQSRRCPDGRVSPVLWLLLECLAASITDRTLWQAPLGPANAPKICSNSTDPLQALHTDRLYCMANTLEERPLADESCCMAIWTSRSGRVDSDSDTQARWGRPRSWELIFRR